MYQSALTTPQQQQVESYLAQKWGITLGTGHPGLTTTVYKSTYIKDKGIKMNTGTNIPFYTAFSPKSVPNCIVWFDAADSSTLGLTGTTVNTWTSKGSFTGNAAADTGTVSYGTITQNGLKVVRFPAGTQLAFTVAMPNQARAIFIVGRNTTQMSPAGNPPYYWALLGTNGTGYDSAPGPYAPSGIAGTSTYTMQFIKNAVGNMLASEGTIADPYMVWNTYEWINSAVSTSSNFLMINGNSVALTANNLASGYFTTSFTRTLNLASLSTGSDIAEVLIYNGEITATQRQQVESYLAQKWGLTSYLPSGHLQFTQPAGARTSLSLANSKLKITSRSTPFLPTSVGGLNGIQLWMDASDSSSASMTLSGSTVTVWKDKSGCGNNTTAYSSTPTLTSSAINGKSAISMGGGYFTGPFATANTGSQIHAFAVLTIDSSGTGAWPRPLSLGRPGANDYSDSTTTFAIIRYSGTQAVGIGRNGQYLSASFPSYSSPFLVQSSHNGSTEYISVNGTLTPSSFNDGQSGNFNITSYGLGVNTNTGDYFVWNGYYGEVIYYNTQLSDTDRQKVEGYLAWKWGIQATLPGGHPYASAAP